MRLVNMTVLYALLDVAVVLWLPRPAAVVCVIGSVLMVAAMVVALAREARRTSRQLEASRGDWAYRSLGA